MARGLLFAPFFTFVRARSRRGNVRGVGACRASSVLVRLGRLRAGSSGAHPSARSSAPAPLGDSRPCDARSKGDAAQGPEASFDSGLAGAWPGSVSPSYRSEVSSVRSPLFCWHGSSALVTVAFHRHTEGQPQSGIGRQGLRLGLNDTAVRGELVQFSTDGRHARLKSHVGTCCGAFGNAL